MKNDKAMMVGVSRNGGPRDNYVGSNTQSWSISGYASYGYYNGSQFDEPPRAPWFNGDIIGVYLDSNFGMVKFYRNGKKCKLEFFHSGLKEELHPAVTLHYLDDQVTLLPMVQRDAPKTDVDKDT